uniref:Death domain-containing protein n=1 Tax=Amphimedon queenslandica TaxID=400682 RepID=A0A1X7T3V7_AMPQE
MERRPTVLELVDFLRTLTKWTNFAQNLPGIEEHHIDKIKAENKDDIDEQKRVLFNKWLAIYHRATFRDVISALEKSHNGALAESISEKLKREGEGASRGMTVSTSNVSKLNETIKGVLDSKFAVLKSATKNSIKSIVPELFSSGIISEEVREKADFSMIVGDFKSNLDLKENKREVEVLCCKLLNGLACQGGPTRAAADSLCGEWKKSIKEKHDIDFNLDQYF